MNFENASMPATVAAAPSTSPSRSRLERTSQSTPSKPLACATVVSTPSVSGSEPARSRETAAVEPLTTSAS